MISFLFLRELKKRKKKRVEVEIDCGNERTSGNDESNESAAAADEHESEFVEY